MKLHENRDNVLRYMMLSVLGPFLDDYIAKNKKKLEEPEVQPKPIAVQPKSHINGDALASSSSEILSTEGLPKEDEWPRIIALGKELIALKELDGKKLPEDRLAELSKPALSKEEINSLRVVFDMPPTQFKTLRTYFKIQTVLDARKAQQEEARLSTTSFEVLTQAGSEEEAVANEETSYVSTSKLMLTGFVNFTSSVVYSAANTMLEYASGAKLSREKVVEMERFKAICAGLLDESNMKHGMEAVVKDLIDQIDEKQGRRAVNGVDDLRGIQAALTAARDRHHQLTNGSSEELLQVYVSSLKWLSDSDVAKALNIIKDYDVFLGSAAKSGKKIAPYDLLSKQIMSDLFRMVFEVQVDWYLAIHPKLAHKQLINDTTRPIIIDLMLNAIIDFKAIEATAISDDAKQRNLLRTIDSVRRRTDVLGNSGLLKEIDEVLARYEAEAKELAVVSLDNAVSVTPKIKFRYGE